MKIKVDSNGLISALYTEDIDMGELGTITSIKRASHVEATPDNKWEADMGPSGGPVLGPFNRRSEALRAEVEWLETNIIR